MAGDLKRAMKEVEKKIVKDLDVLKTPAVALTPDDSEVVKQFAKDAELFFEAHPKAQGLTGKQLGYNIDIIALPKRTGITLYGNLKVSIPKGTPIMVHDEGDYSFMGRYKINRAVECYASGVKIEFKEDGFMWLLHIEGYHFVKDLAYVIQHLTEMNAGIFITSGKRSHIIDRAR